MTRVAIVTILTALAGCRATSSTPHGPPSPPSAHPAPQREPSVATAASAPSAPSGRSVTRTASKDAVRYVTTVGTCELSLEVYDGTSVNAGGASLRRQCDVEGDAGVEALAALIAATKDTSGDVKRHVPLRWLALHGMGGGRGSLMRVRLAAAALRSPDWDRGTGKPSTKRPLNEVIASLVSADVVFPEGQRAFTKHGSCLTTSSVEDVDVRRVAELPARGELIEQGARATDYVPWSAVLWYQVAHGADCP